MKSTFHFAGVRRFFYPVLVAIVFFAVGAQAGNPAEEMFKGEGNTNSFMPQNESFTAIEKSIEQFTHPEFMLRLLLGFSLSVACAWLVAWHPRRASRIDALTDLEERKTLVLLGLVGATIAELSKSSQTLAFVIFGIGALLRFRTALDNPKLTGKAIMVVVIGLACGMGSWLMAVFVTVFSWFLIFWLDSHVACQMRIRLDDEVDIKQAFTMIQSELATRRCRVQSHQIYKGKRQIVLLMHMPSDLDLKQLEFDLRAKLPNPDEVRFQVTVV